MTSIYSVGSTASNTSTQSKSAGQMDQNDFLKLMTTQLTTQDPFNPVDNTQMVAQMAQFSQVAGIAEINKSLKAITEGLGTGRINDAASWIGRSVLVESDKATALKDGSFGGEVALTDDAKDVSVSYVDANGSVVHTENLGAQKKGTLAFSWDGKDKDGKTVGNGPYKIQVTAKDAGGQTVETAVATWVTVNSIESPANGKSTKLLTALGGLTPDKVIRLS